MSSHEPVAQAFQAKTVTAGSRCGVPKRICAYDALDQRLRHGTAERQSPRQRGHEKYLF